MILSRLYHTLAGAKINRKFDFETCGQEQQVVVDLLHSSRSDDCTVIQSWRRLRSSSASIDAAGCVQIYQIKCDELCLSAALLGELSKVNSCGAAPGAE